MKKIYHNITETIGGTSLVRINRLVPSSTITILAKVESFNPSGSVKDRLALAMINAGEEAGHIKKGTTIIEPTSGNTGIGLASICAVRGYSLLLTMPESMSIERRRLLSILGAKIVLTPANQGMGGAVAKAEELVNEIPNSFMPQQFNNPAGPAIHRKTTAEEIWESTSGKFDYFIAGIGTGGTITGCGEVFKSRNPTVRIIGIEPIDSAVISGGKPGPHKIQGIGAGFIPRILNRDVIDEMITVSNDDAIKTARRLATEEGILAGISSGAAMWAALTVAIRKEVQGKKIVVVLPDTGERYISTDLYSNLE